MVGAKVDPCGGWLGLMTGPGMDELLQWAVLRVEVQGRILVRRRVGTCRGWSHPGSHQEWSQGARLDPLGEWVDTGVSG